ncbi:Exostosin-3 [Clonorchis sinensis]|uniref:Exostosin-3 n=1 Tax=Clonorchis sinensis TaxID=79923 RepID=A0A8T1LX38_CLOSI|nr:Exostosin-3 [Clonorchis sinensis]
MRTYRLEKIVAVVALSLSMIWLLLNLFSNGLLLNKRRDSVTLASESIPKNKMKGSRTEQNHDFEMASYDPTHIELFIATNDERLRYDTKTTNHLSGTERNTQLTRPQILHFCLARRTHPVEGISHQLYEALLHNYLRQSECNHKYTAPLKIMVEWNSNDFCAPRANKSMPTHNPVKCLVILPTVDSALKFQNTTTALVNANVPLIVVAPTFVPGSFRPHTDILVSTLCYFELIGTTYSTSSTGHGDRSYLVTISVGQNSKPTSSEEGDGDVLNYLNDLYSVGDTSVDTGMMLSISTKSDELAQCWPDGKFKSIVQQLIGHLKWFPCANSMNVLRKSTFGIVPVGSSHLTTDQFNSFSWQIQLMLCLSSGAVPVLIGEGALPFPLAIDKELWARSIIRIPFHQSNETISVLRSTTSKQIKSLQYYGKMLFRRFFRNTAAYVSTLLLELSNRLGFVKPLAPQWRTVLKVSPSTNVPYYFSDPENRFTEPDLTDLSAAKQLENRQAAELNLQERIRLNPFWSFAFVPWSHSVKQSLFTAVILYYDRYNVLRHALFGLQNAPYLHSIIIVWNHPSEPDKFWLPKSYVPIKIYKAQNNSLNNRFLPLDIIETEAVLALDDDMKLSPAQIKTGFNVWKENRDRLVGFPARSHAYDSEKKAWTYVAGPSSTYSIVLTSGAFLHNYYLYTYTWDMPSEIRQFIDDKRNCEDIAMNFQISHLTRKPPIKVLKESYFPCHGCTAALSSRNDHYQTRSKCINEFINIYGYNPLIHTQVFMDQYV